jgi:hypothetical protein
MLYKRILLYFSRMLSYDLDYVCTSKKVDYKSTKYKDDEYTMFEFFDKFDFKDEFQKIMDVLVREEVFFGCYRDDIGERIGIQQLPSSYSLITGRSPGRLLMDFNMIYFVQPSVDINMFHPIFKEYYYKVFGDKNTSRYIPSATMGERDGTWAQWVQTDPNIFFVFKLFEQLATRIPLFAGMYPDIALQPLYRELAKTSAMASAVNLLKGEVGTNNSSSKGGSLANNFNIDAKNLGQFMQLLRSSVSSVIGVSAAPLQNLNPVSYPLPDRNVYDENMMVTASSSGGDMRLFYGRDRKSIFESEQSLSLDEQIVSAIYREFETFLNLKVNQYVGNKKHKFKFILSGTNFAYARKKKMADFSSLANLGIINASMGAAANNMSVFDFERMLQKSKGKDYASLFTPITPAFQQPQDSGKGRPKSDDSDLSEAGEETRSDGGNIEKGGDV